MQKKIFLSLMILMSTTSFAAPTYKDTGSFGQKFSIDFSQNLAPSKAGSAEEIKKMRAIAQDYCKIQKIKYLDLVSVLKPIEGIKEFSRFFQFVGTWKDGKPILCQIVADEKMELYNASCFYRVK